MSEKAQAYRSLRFFAGITQEDVEALLDCLQARERRYRKGEYVFLDRDEVQNIGLILSGMIHVLKEDSSGFKTLLSYLGQGDVLGESFALQKERSSRVSFYVAKDATLLFIPYSRLMEPCKNACPFHAKLLRNLLQLTGEKHLRLMERIEVASKTSLREKLLAYLQLLAQKQGKKYITVPLNRTEMASYLHSNRSAMCRELSKMKAEGLLDYDGNTFVLLHKT